MSAAKKLQKELMSYIQQMDEKSLRVIHAMVGAYVKQQDIDFWEELTEEQKKQIQLSRDQHKKGEGIPHSEVLAEFRKRYNA